MTGVQPRVMVTCLGAQVSPTDAPPRSERRVQAVHVRRRNKCGTPRYCHIVNSTHVPHCNPSEIAALRRREHTERHVVVPARRSAANGERPSRSLAITKIVCNTETARRNNGANQKRWKTEDQTNTYVAVIYLGHV
jgi:hypothetical protein